mmetsp:Transcript_3204/g.4090  ORF Transcript_3204/g.4090 Transcript_3204/m.4090 type:complete len:91 (-) Transcript_3204:242-514(-)
MDCILRKFFEIFLLRKYKSNAAELNIILMIAMSLGEVPACTNNASTIGSTWETTKYKAKCTRLLESVRCMEAIYGLNSRIPGIYLSTDGY